MTPLPSSSMMVTRRSTSDGGRSASLRSNRPCFNSDDSMTPSPLSSNFEKRPSTDMLFRPIHSERTETTSSATKRTEHDGHDVESRGTSRRTRIRPEPRRRCRGMKRHRTDTPMNQLEPTSNKHHKQPSRWILNHHPLLMPLKSCVDKRRYNHSRAGGYPIDG